MAAPTDDSHKTTSDQDEDLLRDEAQDMLDAWARNEWGKSTLKNMIGFFGNLVEALRSMSSDEDDD